MSRFLFTPMPGHGHVNPTLAVTRELVARGHEVTYLLPEPFRANVEAVGARFELLDIDLPRPAPRAVRGELHLAVLMERLAAMAEHAHAPIERLFVERTPDVLVLESMSPWGRMTAAATGVATAAYSPSYVMAPGTPFGDRMRAAFENAGGPGIDTDRMAAVAARYGVDPVHSGPGLPGDGTVDTAVFVPHAFHPDADAVPGNYHFVGPVAGRPEPDTGFDLGAMAATPGVFVSLGTVFNDDVQFFRSCLTALGDRPAVVASGQNVDTGDLDVPSTVSLAPHVPQLEVLRHTSVFVTHGGMNSTMEATAAGVPLVVVPQMIEQATTAERVAELGMGVHLDPADVTAASLADAIATVDGDPSYRAAARRMAAECRAAGGTTAAADVLEKALPR